MKVSEILKNVMEIMPNFKELRMEDKTWLANLYYRNYKSGMQAIGSDVFSNEEYVTAQSLADRLREYPDTSVHNTEFMRALALGDEASLSAVLDENENQEDFIYEIYEENYSNWIPKSVEKSLENIPEHYNRDDLNLLAKEAFSLGVIDVLDKYAKEAIALWAKNIIESQ